MVKADIIIDSSRYSNLIDEKLKRKSIERLRPSDVFSEAYYNKSEDEKRKIDEIAEKTYKNTLKSIWNQKKDNVNEFSDNKYFSGNLTRDNRNVFELKKEYIQKRGEEREIQQKQEKFIQSTSAKQQKLFREFSSDIVLGDEENTRRKMITYVSNVDASIKTNEEELKKYRQIYPAYSNIFNDENLYIHTELTKHKFTKLKSRLEEKREFDCVANLLTPDTLKYYKGHFDNKTLNSEKNVYNRFRCSHHEEEYNLDQVVANFTPLQRNLSSKLHGSDFYNKAINNTGNVYFVKFRLKNIYTECNEKFIQDLAAKCDSFAYQIKMELDPVLWSSKGTATGKLRFSGEGLKKFVEKLSNELNIEVEILGEVQREVN